MNRIYSNKYLKDLITIMPGEFYVSSEDIFLNTVLGSCISVLLFDKGIQLCGMNHFMLSGHFEGEFYKSESGKYGMAAMELLINALLKAGSRKQSLTAKVFGGGTLLGAPKDSINTVAKDNVRFVLKYLETERIPILAMDVGGNQARKVLVHPQTARVYLKRIVGQEVKEINQIEYNYYNNIQEEALSGGDFISFKE